jgi:hypothetical protein
VAHAPVATSYANTYRTVNKPIAYAAAPVAVAAPALVKSYAPAIHAAPLAYSAGYGYGLGHGLAAPISYIH